MTITKRPNGLEITAIVDGFLVSQFFIGYTIKEAKAFFIEKYGEGDE